VAEFAEGDGGKGRDAAPCSNGGGGGGGGGSGRGRRARTAMRMNQSVLDEGQWGEEGGRGWVGWKGGREGREDEGKRARSCERSGGLASRRDSKREAHGARGRDHVADHRHVGGYVFR